MALLVLCAMGLAAWLQLSYDAGAQRAELPDQPAAVVALPPPDLPEGAGTGGRTPTSATAIISPGNAATLPAEDGGGAPSAPGGGGLGISAWARTTTATVPPPFPGSEPDSLSPAAEPPSAPPPTDGTVAAPSRHVAEQEAVQSATGQPVTPAKTASPARPPEPMPGTPQNSGVETGPQPALEPASAELGSPPQPTVPANQAEQKAPAAGETTLAQAWRVPDATAPARREPGPPAIAIVLSGLGRSKLQTEAIIGRLPPQITLAFNPEGRNLQAWVDQARAHGHEVILELPMEPVSFPENDPGPHTLLTSLPHDQNLERLNWTLDRIDGYSGVINYMGSRFTTSRLHLAPIMAALKDRGLGFLDGRASANSIAAEVAAETGLPVASNNRYIDAEASRAAIGARLAELEEIARAEGQAVGISLSYPVTVDMLAQWAPTLASKGLRLVPLSTVMSPPRAP